LSFILLATSAAMAVSRDDIIAIDWFCGASGQAVQDLVAQGSAQVPMATAWDIRSAYAQEYRSGQVFTVELRDGSRYDVRSTVGPVELAARLELDELVADRHLLRVRTWRKVTAATQRNGSWFTADGAELRKAPRWAAPAPEEDDGQ